MKDRELRASTGDLDCVAHAPVNLVYLAELGRMDEVAEEDRLFLAGADTGGIVQNVYLFCDAAGLGCVVRALIERRRPALQLGLPVDKRISLAQPVGHAASWSG